METNHFDNKYFFIHLSLKDSASVRGGSGGSSEPLDFGNKIIAPLNFEGNFQNKIMCTKI